MTDANKKYYWERNKKYKKEWDNAVKNATRYTDAVDFYKTFRSAQGYHIIIEGEAKTVEEKLVKGFYEQKPSYISSSSAFPEDFVESRTSFDEMIEYADEMKYFIEDLFDTL